MDDRDYLVSGKLITIICNRCQTEHQFITGDNAEDVNLHELNEWAEQHAEQC